MNLRDAVFMALRGLRVLQPLADLITIVPQTGNVPGGSPPKDLIDADVSALQKAPDAVQAADVPAVAAAEEQVTRILDDRHRIKDSRQRDFEVQSLGSRLQTFKQILCILTLFTAAVAAISLVVGGIGVLNIMLVTVTERTQEIGIRKAIGATRRAILQQFLIEAIVLTSLGGVLGIGAGIGLSFLGGAIAPALDPASGAFSTFTPVISIPSVIISFEISVAIGLLAGIYPASRAARLRPIEALRYE